jgi:endonuclease/exonuclease/phosphatase family metal-dependent hydrolase
VRIYGGIIIAVLVMILFSGWIPSYALEGSFEIKILAYNVWGIYDAKFREQRMAAIARAIDEIDPDIVILVEAFEEDHRNIIIEGLESLDSELTHFRYFPNADYGSGIFVLSRFPVIEDEIVPFRVYVPSGSGEEKMGKGMAILRLRTPHGDILVVGLHALSRTMIAKISGRIIQTDARKCNRLLQMYEIAKTLHEKQWEQKVSAVIAGGDFNVFPGLMEYELLMALSGFANAYDELHPEENEPTFSSDNPFTLIPLKCMDQRIDHIIYANFANGKGPRLKARDARVVMKQKFAGPDGKQIHLSDHYGMFAKFALDNNASIMKDAPVTMRPELSPDEKEWLKQNLKKSKPDLQKNQETWTRFALRILTEKDDEIVFKSRAVKAAAKIIVNIHRGGSFNLNLRDKKALLDFLNEHP